MVVPLVVFCLHDLSDNFPRTLALNSKRFSLSHQLVGYFNNAPGAGNSTDGLPGRRSDLNNLAVNRIVECLALAADGKPHTV
jgi:hypothetical protein